jgi:hypothetical protein
VDAPQEIKIMAHYLGAESFSSITIPAAQASRAYRFTQPHSVLIPLDSAANGTGGASSRTLADLFNLTPIPVAPIIRVPSASSTPASSSSVLPSSSSLAFDAHI